MEQLRHNRPGSPVPLRDAPVMQPILDDLAFERAVFQHPSLSIFRRNATTWEVLLMLAGAQDAEGPGLYEIIETVQTRALGPSALLRFLRDRREEGSIVFTRNPHKQSKWTLVLREDLRRDLLMLMRRRDRCGDPWLRA